MIHKWPNASFVMCERPVQRFKDAVLWGHNVIVNLSNPESYAVSKKQSWVYAQRLVWYWNFI